MPSAVLIHRLAAEEYRRIRRWFQVHSITAANRVKQNIFAAIERIADNPQSGPDWRGIARFHKVRRYPYVILLRDDRSHYGSCAGHRPRATATRVLDSTVESAIAVSGTRAAVSNG